MADHVLTFIFPKRLLAVDCIAELKHKMPDGWAFREVSGPKIGIAAADGSDHSTISVSGPENDVAESDIAAIAGRYSGRLDHV